LLLMMLKGEETKSKEKRCATASDAMCFPDSESTIGWLVETRRHAMHRYKYSHINLIYKVETFYSTKQSG
jgi:hypothetical protein